MATAQVDFTDRVVAVTGGSRGVGRAIVEAFLAAGAQVVACGRHAPEADDALFAQRATFVVADVREPEGAQQLVDQAVAAHGRLDVLVNNAGGAPNADAAEVSPRFVASVVALNLLAPFYCAQAANRVMQAQGAGGVILNIGSVSGVRPSPGAAAYGAAKAGLVNLTETLAVEWAPKVRINCITAGLLDTGAGADFYGGEEGLRRVAATVPLGRLGTPADVAGLCLLLASPLAAYVSGANLVAHGGGEWPSYMAVATGDG
jgi:NAD(P)-dependent dehydrogenase (short-subunit alcohol dehydrogenase family)